MMIYITEFNKSIPYINCQPGWMLSSEQDAANLVCACAENDTYRILIPGSVLPPGFYDLRTGLAGAILGKFSIYRMRVGFTIPLEKMTLGRFGEMVLECNRGNEIHFTPDYGAAIAWLISG